MWKENPEICADFLPKEKLEKRLRNAVNLTAPTIIYFIYTKSQTFPPSDFL